MSGNTEATRDSQSGSSPPMTNMPEMKASTMDAPIAIACAMAAVADTVATARPSAEKDARPTRTVTSRAGAVSARTSTP
nr:hypothetical protein [Cryobacterium sp. Sr8]